MVLGSPGSGTYIKQMIVPSRIVSDSVHTHTHMYIYAHVTY